MEMATREHGDTKRRRVFFFVALLGALGALAANKIYAVAGLGSTEGVKASE